MAERETKRKKKKRMWSRKRKTSSGASEGQSMRHWVQSQRAKAGLGLRGHSKDC